MQSVTIKDVAKQAGVSTATVSHVINHTRFVSEKVRVAVEQAMNNLQYQPNAIAKSLRQKSTKTIGLMISDISNPFFTQLVRGVEDVANKKGYNLILCNTDEDPKKERMYLDVLVQKQLDGIILAPTSENIGYIQKLRNQCPMVFVDRYLDGVEGIVVTSDNEDGAYQAVRHLIHLGHKRVGFIAGLPDISTTKDRLRGYERALRDHDIAIETELIQHGHSKAAGGYDSCQVLLGLPVRPTAIFAANNLMNIGVMRALQDANIQCPQDMAVVGFDDFDWATAFRPFLTTVAQPVYELGMKAAESLIAQLRKKGKQPSRVTLPCTLIVRESCGSLGKEANDGRFSLSGRVVD